MGICLMYRFNVMYTCLQTHINGQKFSYLFNKYVLCIFHVLSTLVGAGGTVMRVKLSTFRELTF